jgi:hypothetical protein
VPGKRYNAMVKAAGGKKTRAGDRYHALRRAGLSKSIAARITIKGRTKAGRRRMARKAARTRRRRR